MKALRFIAAASLLMAGVSCTTIRDKGWRDDPERGTGYDFIALQWFGGTMTAESSMGAKAYSDNQKSWGDFMQFAALAVPTIANMKIALAKEITERALQGEITARQAAQLKFDLAAIQTEAGLQQFVAELPFKFK